MGRMRKLYHKHIPERTAGARRYPVTLVGEESEKLVPSDKILCRPTKAAFLFGLQKSAVLIWSLLPVIYCYLTLE